MCKEMQNGAVGAKIKRSGSSQESQQSESVGKAVTLMFVIVVEKLATSFAWQ